MHTFLCQAVSKSPFYKIYTNCPFLHSIYYLLLEQLNLVSLPTPNSFISDLAFTTPTNPILRSKLNFEKVKNVLIPELP